MIACVLLLLSSLSPLSASLLEDKRKEASDLKNQVSQVDNELAGSVNAYEGAYAQLTEINMAIQNNLVQLDATNKKLAKNKSILSTRVDSIYRDGNTEFISVILGARDFENFLSRLDYLKKICAEDARRLKSIERLKRIAERRDAELSANKARQRIVLNKVNAEKAGLERALKQKGDLLATIQTEVKALEEEEKRRLEEERKRALESAIRAANNANNANSNPAGSRNAATTFAPDSSWRFPVTQPYSYCDSWHAPRVGHLHQGTDIFALRGTPAIACVDGIILRLSTGKLGGIGMTLQDKNGNTYYYGHLDGYATGVYQGMPVSASQTLGYVGDTGNAKGTPPHVHFEIHPGGGPATNPYPILKLVG